jgi:hypothetical protein
MWARSDEKRRKMGLIRRLPVFICRDTKVQLGWNALVFSRDTKASSPRYMCCVLKCVSFYFRKHVLCIEACAWVACMLICVNLLHKRKHPSTHLLLFFPGPWSSFGVLEPAKRNSASTTKHGMCWVTVTLLMLFHVSTVIMQSRALRSAQMLAYQKQLCYWTWLICQSLF